MEKTANEVCASSMFWPMDGVTAPANRVLAWQQPTAKLRMSAGYASVVYTCGGRQHRSAASAVTVVH